jgi:hypothetical protein
MKFKPREDRTDSMPSQAAPYKLEDTPAGHDAAVSSHLTQSNALINRANILRYKGDSTPRNDLPGYGR